MVACDVLVILGTRPEAIKLAPVLLELEKSDLSHQLICTGQHVQMVKEVLEAFKLIPNFWLNEREPTEGMYLSSSFALICQQLTEIIATLQPKRIMVQGDTISALAGAMVGYFSRIQVVHVEAGLRSGDYDHPYPEEYNRIVIGHSSGTHFPPTEMALQNLLKEGVSPHRCRIVGNPVIDALFRIREMPRLVTLPKKIILVTAHRRESWGEPIREICEAIAKLAQTYPDQPIYFFAHPNPIVQKDVKEILGTSEDPKYENCLVYQAAPYREFVDYLLQSRLVITDSGGLQEETTALGIPTVVTRETTERTEGLGGPLKLVGTETSSVFEETEKLLTNEEYYASRTEARTVYGDGTSAQQMVKFLLTELLPEHEAEKVEESELSALV